MSPAPTPTADDAAEAEFMMSSVFFLKSVLATNRTAVDRPLALSELTCNTDRASLFIVQGGPSPGELRGWVDFDLGCYTTPCQVLILSVRPKDFRPKAER